MATGRWDFELSNRAFWSSLLGVELDQAKLAAMHPLRRALDPPPEKSPELKAAESKAGWAMIHQAMAARAKRG